MAPKVGSKRPIVYRPRRQLAWEKGLPKPPKPVDVLREVILSKVSFHQPKIFHDLHREVVDDYGPISERVVYRHLKWMVDGNLVERVSYDEDPCYLRKGSWKESSCQTHVDTELNAP